MELPSYVLELLYREAPRISCRILLTEGHNVLFYLALAPPCRSACSPGRSEATTTSTTNIPPDPSAATDMNIGHRRWGVPFHFRRLIPSPVTLTGTSGWTVAEQAGYQRGGGYASLNRLQCMMRARMIRRGPGAREENKGRKDAGAWMQSAGFRGPRGPRLGHESTTSSPMIMLRYGLLARWPDTPARQPRYLGLAELTSLHVSRGE